MDDVVPLPCKDRPIPVRIAALSDIHGNLPALRAVLDDIRGRGVDLIVDLGDKLSGPLWPLETADLLMSRDIVHIAGNHERQLLTLPPDRMGASDRHAHAVLGDGHRAWLAALPAGALLADGEVLLCHGTPASDHSYLLEEVGEWGSRPAAPERVAALAGDGAARLVLCGHSHLPRALRLEDGRLVVNPGSVGLQAYYDDHLFSHTHQTRSPHARYTLLERGADGHWRAEAVALSYDWEAAAKRAARHGSATWARALRYGHLD